MNLKERKAILLPQAGRHCLDACGVGKQVWIVFTVVHRREIDPATTNLNSTLWFEHDLSGALHSGGPTLEADFADPLCRFPSIDETGAVAGFSNWDINLTPFSSTGFNPLTASSAADGLSVSAAPSTIEDHQPSEDDDKDSTDDLSLQLISLSQRARRAMRRLVRPGGKPLTVSSPEVNEALEDTNDLIRIIHDITAKDRDAETLDATTTNYGLVFSTLACHQHIVSLFQAICDAIHQCLQSKMASEQQHHRRRQHNEVGPASVAQFVMVLQLLMHLINRMNRSLLQNSTSMWHDVGWSTGGHITPNTPTTANHHIVDQLPSEAAAKASSAPGGLLVFVQKIVATIPNEHEKLRRAIQKLQAEIEHSELH
nr:hypothetical protein [Aspergillus sp.]